MPRTSLPESAKDYTPSAPDQRPGFMDLMAPAPQPDTELARYRILTPKAGLRVSPLCLGAMSLGDQWTGYMGGGLNAAESEKILDLFYESGGNFIDTSNNYQDEQSEMIIGEWMERKGIRDEMVIATKYTTYPMDRKEGRAKGIMANYAGNHAKNLRHTVEDSLKKLRTDYIDILYLHWFDYTTDIESIMLALNDLVRRGLVLHLGISDTPAWIVAEANTWAKDHGMHGFVVYQGHWNLASRDLERDVLPMCRRFGLALAPWGVLGAGKFKDPEELKARAKDSTLRAGMESSPAEIKVCEALAEVAKELGGNVALANVAMAWCRQKYPFTFPIIGGTKAHHLKSNIDALKIHLTEDQMQKLEDAVPHNWGFPYAFFGRDPRGLPGGKPESALLNTAGHIQFVPYH